MLRAGESCKMQGPFLKWCRESESDAAGSPAGRYRQWIGLLVIFVTAAMLFLPRVRACFDLSEHPYPYKTHYCFADPDCTTSTGDPDVCQFDVCEMSWCHGYYSFCVHNAYCGWFPSCWGTVQCY